MAFGFDPRIILGHQQYTGPDANETMRTLADLAGRRSQLQAQQASLADMAEQRQRGRSLADIYRQSASNPEGLSSALMAQGFGQEAFQAREQEAQLGAKRAQGMKFEQEAVAAAKKFAGDHLYGADTPEKWAKQWSLLPEPFKAQVPEQFDPAVYEAVKGWAVPAADRAKLDATASAAEQQRKFLAEENAKNRANKTVNAGIIAGDRAAARDAKAEGDLGDDIRDLRKEISGRKEVAKYRASSAELDSLRALAKDSTGANDMALVFAFMKALDPDSAVREAEYNAAAATGTPDQRMMGLVSKYWTGGPLSPGQRQAFIKAAEAAQSGHKAAYERAAKTYRYTAKKRGYDLGEVGLEDSEAPSGPHGPTVTQNGHTYEWNPETGSYE